METLVGTPYYIAPEVIDYNYDMKCDVWSMGVMLYVMLSGFYPFFDKSRVGIFSKIKSGQFDFDQKEFAKVSDEAKNLIKRMLQVNPKNRYST